VSDQQSATPPGPNGILFVLLLWLGIILLLPGLCSLVMEMEVLFYGYVIPLTQFEVVSGLVIGAGGVALITFAIRLVRRR
jgi:hypothetical protein